MRSRRVPSSPSSGASGRFEEEAYARGYQAVAGLDEAGRGPWAGPVVAAAVILPREFLVSGFALGTTRSFDGLRIDPEQGRRVDTRYSILEIKDSKLLTARKREALAPWIKERAVAWGLGIVPSDEIDRMNILQASLLAMAQALRQLQQVPDCLLIDGPHKIPLEFLSDVQTVQEVQNVLNDLNGSKRFERMPYQRAIKKGDRLSISIAAASIVAKVTRDQMMMEYDRLYPGYGFGQHKGYGSAAHLAALSRYGPSPIHRRSFRPVRECSAGSPSPLSLPLSPLKGEREG